MSVPAVGSAVSGSTAQRLSVVVHRLAAEEFKGRRVGTPGGASVSSRGRQCLRGGGGDGGRRGRGRWPGSCAACRPGPGRQADRCAVARSGDASDNRRYAGVGLAAIGIGMGMPGYQTPAETPDRVEAETLVAAADLVTATVVRLVVNSAFDVLSAV